MRSAARRVPTPVVAPPAPATDPPAVATISLPAVACFAPNRPHGGRDADEHPDDKMTHDRRRGHDRRPAPDGPEGREQ
ncbi:hypothetical protein FQA18_13505 [Haloferax volcanii]|uniref:Uncharacterized protein n=1 Tax=Haloferax volcanii TaxID=2246 RepID=A0A558G8Q6_HALVO|nr:hypothetical protein [Haloferax alexandrinus]TVT94157.1 hypothetical protein FQA18_13505 [Haloferax volcanii]